MDKQITKSLEALEAGGVVLYPSDTVWGLACDATNHKAVDKLFKLKKRSLDKSVLIQIDSIEKLIQYAQVPIDISKLLQKYNQAITVVYNYKKGLSPLVVAKDNTLAARIPKDKFTRELLAKFNKPIVSTSANISSETLPKSFKEVSSEILQNVDYIVALRQDETMNQPSKIIKIEGDTIIEIR